MRVVRGTFVGGDGGAAYWRYPLWKEKVESSGRSKETRAPPPSCVMESYGRSFSETGKVARVWNVADTGLVCTTRHPVEGRIAPTLTV